MVKISFLLLFLNEGLHYILPIRYAVCDNPVACYHVFARNCLRRWVFDRTSELSHKVVLLLFVWRIRLCVLDEPGFWKGRGERRRGERARERECERDRVMPQENKQREKEGETGRENQRVQQRQRGFWKVGGEQETGGSQKRKRE